MDKKMAIWCLNKTIDNFPIPLNNRQFEDEMQTYTYNQPYQQPFQLDTYPSFDDVDWSNDQPQFQVPELCTDPSLDIDLAELLLQGDSDPFMGLSLQGSLSNSDRSSGDLFSDIFTALE